MRIAYTFDRKHFAHLKKIVTRVLERILNPHDPDFEFDVILNLGFQTALAVCGLRSALSPLFS